MVDGPNPTTGGQGATTQRFADVQPFGLIGEATFLPMLFPERINPRKERQTKEEQGFCGDEYVTDQGGKNMRIHVSGTMVGVSEKEDFLKVASLGEPLDMSSAAWSGEVIIKEGDYEGPTGFTSSGELLFEYSLDLIGTGRDDGEPTRPDIVGRGEAEDDEGRRDRVDGVR